MRPTSQIKTTRPIRDRPAACACAALAWALLIASPATAVAAGEAGNPFAPASPAAPSAAKQAGGAGSAAGTSPKSAPGAGHTAAGAARSSAGAGKAATGATPAKGAILPSQLAKTTTTASTSTSTQESSSGANTVEILGLVAAGVLLVGIAFMILRDARSVAPVTEGLATGGTRNPEGRLRKRRAQAKAARLQRKRHRKR